MKCTKCGFENALDAVVCASCGASLVEETEETKETNLEKTIIDAEVNEKEPEDKAEAVKEQLKKIHLKPETKQKIMDTLKEALQFIKMTLIHPNQTYEAISWGAVGIVTVCIAIVNCLWLYIMQRGLLDYVKQVALYTATPVKMSSLATILTGFVMTILILLVLAVLVVISYLMNKQKVRCKGSVINALDAALTPCLLLLMTTIVSAFWYKVGVVLNLVVCMALFMNIVLLFKDHNVYVSYIIVTIASLLILFIVIYGLYYCVNQWTINGRLLFDYFETYMQMFR